MQIILRFDLKFLIIHTILYYTDVCLKRQPYTILLVDNSAFIMNDFKIKRDIHFSSVKCYSVGNTRSSIEK